GIEEPLLLRFHDSARKERQRHDDPHALAKVDMLDVEAAIRGIIADVKPHVIVTFEPHGGYYHPTTSPFTAPRRRRSSRAGSWAAKRPSVCSTQPCSAMCSGGLRTPAGAEASPT